jgi:hypothetical protein
MSHTNTNRMLDYWAARRGETLAPPRASIDPAEFSDVITQAFMIGRTRLGLYPFRLAGGLLEDLHRRALLGCDFMSLWAVGDRPKVQAAIEACLYRGEALVAQALARSLHGLEARLEIVMAPLINPTGEIDRILGLYQPVSPLFKLQNEPVERLFLQTIAFADGGMATPAPLRIAAVDGRRIA